VETFTHQGLVVGRLPTLALPADARARWRELCGDNPFRRLEWLENWWRAYGADASEAGRRCELFTLVALREGRIVGVAPWFREYSAAAGHSIRSLGAGGVCSEYLGLMIAPGYEIAFGEALAATLSERRATDRGTQSPAPPWDFLEFKGIRSDDAAVEALLARLSAGGCSVHRRRAPPCWRLDLPDTWDDYLGQLSHSHRKQVRRIERRLFATGRAVMRRAVDEASLDRGLVILTDLHQRRWERLGQTGCFADRRFTTFLCEAARAQLDAGDLSLHWLELDGRPIAAEYHLVSGRAIYAYQSGIDPDALGYEPGRMITVALVRDAIAAGRKTYDFLRGDEPYKAHFRARPLEMTDIRLAPPTTSARLRETLWLAGDSVKSWLKAGLGRSVPDMLTGTN